MRSVNKVILLGNVGQEPKIISTSTGGLIANFSIATSYSEKPRDGQESHVITEWHRLIAFGRTAEIIRDYVRKGAKLYVDGYLQTRSWDKDGEKRYSTEIVIREMSLLSSSLLASAAAPAGAAFGTVEAETAAARANSGRVNPEIQDDERPF